MSFGLVFFLFVCSCCWFCCCFVSVFFILFLFWGGGGWSGRDKLNASVALRSCVTMGGGGGVACTQKWVNLCELV